MDFQKYSTDDIASVLLHSNRQRGKESEFPEHHDKFTAYNQLQYKVPYRDEDSKLIYPILTGLMINESTRKDMGVDTESSTSMALTTRDLTNEDKSIPG
nr:hypothetical protein [Tanacetum cinerariifolium]